MYPPVKSCGEKDLQDNGRRHLDEEICSRLDDYYPDWKDPEGTHMVPRSFISKANNPNLGEITEKHFFDILKEFGEIKKEPMFVIHSYKFSEYIPMWQSGKISSTKMSNWVMGEHDFVMVHHVHGVVFFQVKATKTSGGHHKADSQIQKDKLALKRFFQKMIEAGIMSNKQVDKIFNKFPAFVVLPNTQRGQSLSAKDHVLYQEDCTDAQTFSEWWYGKFPVSEEHSEIDQTIYEYLVMRFVGMVHVSPLLDNCINRIEKTLMFKTVEQVELLVGHYPPKLWIRGPAGSGKTMLLLEKAKSLASSILEHKKNENILIVCFNAVLCKKLQSVLETQLVKSPDPKSVKSNFLDVKTFSKLIMDVTGSRRIPTSNDEKEAAVSSAFKQLSTQKSDFRGKYDHILVDEGQDLFGSKWPALLELMHKSSVTSNVNEEAELEDLLKPAGFFWVMYDTNQYLYFSKELLKLFSGYLQNSAELKKVLRNTGNIFKQSEKYFKSLMTSENGITLGHQEYGLPIKWDTSLENKVISDDKGASTIIPHLEELREEHVQERDICILVETVAKRKSFRQALSKYSVETQTADNLVEKNDNKIVVESIRCFKGLESKVVILYNPPYEDDSERNGCAKELLYTAVSRCCCYLIVITTKAGGEALISAQGIQETTDNRAKQVPRQFPTSSHLDSNREPFQSPMDIDTE